MMSLSRECIVYLIDDSSFTVPIKVSHIWSSMSWALGVRPRKQNSLFLTLRPARMTK